VLKHSIVYDKHVIFVISCNNVLHYFLWHLFTIITITFEVCI